LIKALRPKGVMERELGRLYGEGFQIRGGSWDESNRFSGETFPGAGKLRKALDGAPKNHWAGFQLYYAMNESDVRSATGLDLVESMLAVFKEVTAVMNMCMQVELKSQGPRMDTDSHG
jgi:hypothetical protein